MATANGLLYASSLLFTDSGLGGEHLTQKGTKLTRVREISMARNKNIQVAGSPTHMDRWLNQGLKKCGKPVSFFKVN